MLPVLDRTVGIARAGRRLCVHQIVGAAIHGNQRAVARESDGEGMTAVAMPAETSADTAAAAAQDAAPGRACRKRSEARESEEALHLSGGSSCMGHRPRR